MQSDEDDSDDEPVELGTEMLLQAPTAEESDDGSFDEDGVRRARPHCQKLQTRPPHPLPIGKRPLCR